jgi:hypothetical protein
MARCYTDAQIEEAMAAAKVSLATEGFTLTTEDEQLLKAHCRGDISRAEFLRRAKEQAERSELKLMASDLS